MYRRWHYLSGLILTIFIGLHLFNHAISISGADTHIELMAVLRKIYRNIFIESLLLLVVIIQIISGFKLLFIAKKNAISFFEKLQILTGLYLSVFLLIHISAVFAGRYLLHLDTNLYFGVAGLNYFPENLFFIPYYALAIISFFGHIASIHNKKMTSELLGLSVSQQSKIILLFGVVFTFFAFLGMTNHFKGYEIPSDYKVLFINQGK